MVSLTRALSVVYKQTGGKRWVKPWGLTLSKTQKLTREKDASEVQSVAAILRQAANSEPIKAAAEAAPQPTAATIPKNKQ